MCPAAGFPALWARFCPAPKGVEGHEHWSLSCAGLTMTLYVGASPWFPRKGQKLKGLSPWSERFTLPSSTALTQQTRDTPVPRDLHLPSFKGSPAIHRLSTDGHRDEKDRLCQPEVGTARTVTIPRAALLPTWAFCHQPALVS